MGRLKDLKVIIQRYSFQKYACFMFYLILKYISVKHYGCKSVVEVFAN